MNFPIHRNLIFNKFLKGKEKGFFIIIRNYNGFEK